MTRAAATEWFPYDPQSIGMPRNGEWCLWSVVTKHGREYYSGAIIKARGEEPELFDDRGLPLPLNSETYWARVRKMENE